MGQSGSVRERNTTMMSRIRALALITFLLACARGSTWAEENVDKTPFDGAEKLTDPNDSEVGKKNEARILNLLQVMKAAKGLEGLIPDKQLNRILGGIEDLYRDSLGDGRISTREVKKDEAGNPIGEKGDWAASTRGDGSNPKDKEMVLRREFLEGSKEEYSCSWELLRTMDTLIHEAKHHFQDTSTFKGESINDAIRFKLLKCSNEWHAYTAEMKVKTELGAQFLKMVTNLDHGTGLLQRASAGTLYAPSLIVSTAWSMSLTTVAMRTPTSGRRVLILLRTSQPSIPGMRRSATRRDARESRVLDGMATAR